VNEDFLGLTQSLHPNAGIVTQLGYDRSFLNPFLFIIHHRPTIRYSTVRKFIVSAMLSNKVYRYTCPIPKGLRGRATRISLYISKVVDKKEMLRTVLIPLFIVQVTKLVQFT
jgi:hypothetical protein